MKVILNSYGYMGDKRFLKAIEGMSEFEWRTNEDVIALIEKRQNEIKYLCKLKNQNKITESQQSRLDKLTDGSEDWLYFKVKEVDTSRKWAIGDYDTSKYIQYLDIVDEKINFYGFI